MAAISTTRKLAVVPAYNEAASVGDVVNGLQGHALTYDVLVVDDGSTDSTARMAREGTHVLSLPFNPGIGGAVQASVKYAAKNGYSYMGQVDGDGSTTR
jgi:glycosyltransferase involved in cell wall biosynthesis